MLTEPVLITLEYSVEICCAFAVERAVVVGASLHYTTDRALFFPTPVQLSGAPAHSAFIK